MSSDDSVTCNVTEAFESHAQGGHNSKAAEKEAVSGSGEGLVCVRVFLCVHVRVRAFVHALCVCVCVCVCVCMCVLCVCVRVQVAVHRRSGPTSPSDTPPLRPNAALTAVAAPTAAALPLDSTTSPPEWIATIVVGGVIVAVTTWLTGGCAKRKRESYGFSAADATLLEEEVNRVYGTDGSGRVGGLGDGPLVSAADYLGVVAQWRQAMPDFDFSAANVPTSSRYNGTRYPIKPGAVKFYMNNTEIDSGMPRRTCCSFDTLCAAAVANAAKDVVKGPDGLVPKEFDLLRAAITELVVLAATVGVRRSYFEDKEASIRTSLGKHLKEHREAACKGASVNRFSQALLTKPPADVSERALESASVAQAGKSLT